MDLSDISIIKILPPNLQKDRNVCMMCEAFDEELRRLIAGIPGIEVIPNLVLKKVTDNLLLDLLAWQFHCDFYSPDFSIEKKQELILKSLDWHTRKGTPSVIEEIVSTVFSKAEIEEWFDYGGLPYRFRISTENPLLDMAEVENLVRAISSVKNTRSWLDVIIYIARAKADAYAGIMPGVNGITHIPAKEYEPYTYYGTVTGISNLVNVFAKEYEPRGYHFMIPEINMRIDILSSEV